jgi:hypothetical protein
MRESIKLFLPVREAKYFLRGGWTLEGAGIAEVICPSGKSVSITSPRLRGRDEQSSR